MEVFQDNLCFILETGFFLNKTFHARELGYFTWNQEHGRHAFFVPVPYKTLSEKEKRTVIFVISKIHGLSYQPSQTEHAQKPRIVGTFIKDLYQDYSTAERTVVGYKGGHVEKEQGYRKAQEILYHRFGQKHIIAHAHIMKIVEGPQIKNTDVTGLLDLSVQMQNCALTLIQMGYEADVNSSDNLVMVVKRLPVHLQSKWADRAGSLTLAGTERTFKELAGFVEEEALLANAMYGRIVGATPEKDRSSKPPPKVNPLFSKGNTFATQSEDGPQVNTASILICPLCSGQHRLWKCELMKAKSPEERKGFVREENLCYNCLGRGHMAMECRSKMKCQVNGCGWKHHTMLHVKKKSSSNSSPLNHPAVTSEETGTSTISGAGGTGTSTIRGAGETGTSTVSGAGDTGRCGATESGKKNVCLRIVPAII